MDERLIH